MTHDERATPDEGASGTRGTESIYVRRRRLVVLGALAAVAAVLVGWAALRGPGKPAPPPLPPGAVAIDVWAPYWTLSDTVAEVPERLAVVREASPFWYGARGVAEIVVDQHADDDRMDAFIDALAATPAAFVPSIRDEMPAGGMARILADPDTRSAHIDALVAFADELGAAGLDLDYEQFAFADGRSTWATTRPHWTAFVEQLAAALHADGRTLTISIPPVYDDGETDASGYWVYDHGTIAEHVDAIRIMAYDFSVAEAGPIAPLEWVRTVVTGVSAAVPTEYHDRLVLGVPAYGSNWVASTAGSCPADAEGKTTVSVRSVGELAQRRGGVPAYDSVSGEWAFGYELRVDDGSTACVQTRAVRWVGAEGIAARTELARRAGWGGVALWALGYEDAAAWRALVASAHGPMAGAPATTPDGP